MVYYTRRFLGTNKSKTVENLDENVEKITTDYRQGKKLERRTIVYLEKHKPVKKEEISFWADNTPMLVDTFVKRSKGWFRTDRKWVAKGEA